MIPRIDWLGQNNSISSSTEEMWAFSGALHDYSTTQAFLNNLRSLSRRRLEMISTVLSQSCCHLMIQAEYKHKLISRIKDVIKIVGRVLTIIGFIN